MNYYSNGGVVIRDSVESDIADLGGRLRDADEKEVIASGYVNGEDALRQSFARSEVRYTVELAGRSVGMCGIVRGSVLAGNATVWFLGAPELAKTKKTFVKLSRRFFANALLQFPMLTNAVDGRYESSIRWLRSCGAEFSDVPMVLNGVPFFPFVIRRS